MHPESFLLNQISETSYLYLSNSPIVSISIDIHIIHSQFINLSGILLPAVAIDVAAAAVLMLLV